MIVVNEVLSVLDRQKLEAYLAHKWGLSSHMPNSHPYKSASPIVDPRDLESYTVDLSGLTPGNTYNYRVAATNSQGTDWADSTATFTSESAINLSSGTLVFNTSNSTPTWYASDGSGGNGVLETLSWTDSQSNTVQHKVAKFSFSQINIGDGVKVSLVGSNPIHLDVENNATILAKLDASGTQGSNFSVLGGGLGGGLGTTNLTFSTGQSNNHDLSNTYGSNISSSSSGATVVYGGTPDISLAWTAAANVLEVHGSTNQYWNHIDSSTSVDVLQLDLNGGEADPYITFSVGVGKALSLESVLIGHSTAQTISDYPWTLTITKVGGSQVFSHTTAAMGAGDKEQVDFNFTGEFGASYILKFSDNGISDASAAIDNLKFSQIYGTGGFHGSGPSHIVGANPYNSGGSRYKGGNLSGSGLVAGEAPGGGSYGGKGGRPELNGGTDSLGAHPISGQTYGNINVDALLAGSGGGAGSIAFGGTGGGAIKITAGGKLIIGKDIYANGGMGNSDSTNDAAKSGAGGSGGVVYLKANDLVINSGVSIRADGGPGAPLATGGNTGATDSGGTGSAAGGGGRVYLEGTNLFLNQGSLSNENLSANKGGEAVHSPFPSGINGLKLWLDASDSSTITKDGSNKVSQWSDRSGNNNHATQGTAANQPTLGTNEIEF